MIMNKIVGMAALLLCLTGCVRDNDAIYYPVGDVDIERGGPALEVGEEDVLVARSFNEEDYVLDTIAQYPNDPTLGKLTFMIDLKNQQKDQNVADFNGVGKSKLTMSLGYKDGNYPSESQVPMDDRLWVCAAGQLVSALSACEFPRSLYVQGRYEAGDFRFVPKNLYFRYHL